MYSGKWKGYFASWPRIFMPIAGLAWT